MAGPNSERKAAYRNCFSAEPILRKADSDFAAGRILPRFKRLALRKYPQGNMVPPHRHLDYEAVLLCSGAYRFRINGTEMELTPGEGILVNIGDQHEDWRGDGAKFIGFSFTLEAFPATNGIPALLAPGVSPQEQRFRIDLKEAEGLARKIYEEEQRQTAFSRLIQEAISLELFWRIIQGLPRESLSTGFLDNTADGSFRARLSRLFQDHIEEVLTLDDIAKQLGISRTSLTNKCNELFVARQGFLPLQNGTRRVSAGQYPADGQGNRRKIGICERIRLFARFPQGVQSVTSRMAQKLYLLISRFCIFCNVICHFGACRNCLFQV